MGSISTEEKPFVLVADDDAPTRMLLRATITQWNYPVKEARDGEEAWKILQEKDAPQIVTVDWMMPIIDGVSLCQLARKLPTPPYMILLTSVTGSANIINALESGADDFLSKPFNYAELRSRLHVGQRIIAFRNKLEAIIKAQSSLCNHISKELPLIFGKMHELIQQIQKERNCSGHNLHDREKQNVLQEIADNIYVQQQELTAKIKIVEDMVEQNWQEKKIDTE